MLKMYVLVAVVSYVVGIYLASNTMTDYEKLKKEESVERSDDEVFHSEIY